MDDLALLVLRLVVGALVAGHGAQKLFGAFGGSGLAETAAFLAGLGLRPAPVWALLAGLAELGGGLLTLLGLLYPLAPVAILAAMAMAIVTVHWGRPVWTDQGGAELPLTNAAVAAALVLAGPGSYALDQALGLDLGWLTVPATAAAALGIAVALLSRDRLPADASSTGRAAREARRTA